VSAPGRNVELRTTGPDPPRPLCAVVAPGAEDATAGPSFETPAEIRASPA
jgi:hypothetical protein